jgi:hypothetical protein
MNLKKYLCLYHQLRHHRILSERRDPNFTRNKVSKIMFGISISLIFIYLIMLAILMAMAANESHSTSSIGMLCVCIPFILVIDFFVRLLVQQTPAQIVKPYVLLPLPRQACIDNFIATSLLSWGNLTWFTFFLPYVIMSVLFSYGFFLTLYLSFFLWIIILSASQFYAISRTLISFKFIFWLLPLAVFALMLSPMYLGKSSGMNQFVDVYSSVGETIAHGNVIPLFVVLICLAVLIFINRRVQLAGALRELTKVNQTKLRTVSNFSVLDRYGQIGMYLQLEIKSILRNKIVKQSFIYAFVVSVIFIFVVSFTDIYDSPIFLNFFGIYIFVTFGGMILSKMMGYEGNYIEAIMVHKENILSLLKAKYLFFCGMTIIFYLLTLPSVLAGKWTLIMLTSYAIFTCGFQYFMLFQTGVYNKQTIKLNSKLTGKGGIETNYFSVIIGIICMTLPVFLVWILQQAFKDDIVYLIMALIGIAFIVTNNFWIRNIYKRMMKRRYANLEGFRQSR